MHALAPQASTARNLIYVLVLSAVCLASLYQIKRFFEFGVKRRLAVAVVQTADPLVFEHAHRHAPLKKPTSH